MKRVHGNIFYVPRTAEPLYWSDITLDGVQVQNGWLGSADGSVRYPVRNGIPSFVAAEEYTGNFGFQWQKHSKVQLDSFNGTSYSRDRLFDTAGWSHDMKLNGKLVLEAGSGAGRFTEILALTGALIYSFDASEAVFANYASNGRKDNVAIFRANIYDIPFREKTFDYVFCLGVLQHTPDVKKSFQSLARMVRPGGSLIVDVYPRVWRHLLHWKYLMRPFTTGMDPQKLYSLVNWYVPRLLPLSKVFDSLGGVWLRRLVPVLAQHDKKVPESLQREWAILDTYDALSATYDQPQTGKTLRSWFEEEGYKNIRIDSQRVTGTGIAT